MISVAVSLRKHFVQLLFRSFLPPKLWVGESHHGCRCTTVAQDDRFYLLNWECDMIRFRSGEMGCRCTVVRNAELKIVDPDTSASLGRNQPGEICIRGEQIMKGYLNDLEATKNTIDKDGWLHTGDIGYVDDDDEIFIVDRLKEIIKYKGFQVPPAELEALLITHPEIKDAAVVSMKDELAGEVPVAFIIRSEGSEISENEIKQFVAKEVVFYKRINRVFFTDSIPKNPSGKILRKDLRARLAAGIPSSDNTQSKS